MSHAGGRHLHAPSHAVRACTHDPCPHSRSVRNDHAMNTANDSPEEKPL